MAASRRKNRKKSKQQQLSFKDSRVYEFRQDVAGVLLLALAAFILVSNFSSSTGMIGLYVIKNFIKKGIGIGVYVLPVFLAVYGLILLIRHEVKELTVRLTGLLILFITFVTAAQFYSPTYFSAIIDPFSGAGGALGFGIKAGLIRVVGDWGSYILLVAFAIISLILLFNVTIVWLISILVKIFTSLFKGIFENIFFRKIDNVEKKKSTKRMSEEEIRKEFKDEIAPIPEPKKPEEKQKKTSVAEFMPILKDIKPYMPEKIVEATTSSEPIKVSSEKYKDYKLPPLDLLDDPSNKEKHEKDKMRETTEVRKHLLQEALRNFGVGAQVVGVSEGPAVTRYEIQPEPGVKVSRIFSLADDIALNMACGGVRIEGPVPGKTVIGIEVPNTTVTPVRLKTIASKNEFLNSTSKLTIGLGQDLSGTPIYSDLSRMPHLLVAGTTGSGKSVCINTIITSILLKARPDEVKFIMIDPKMVELSIYDGIPHLLAPVVTRPRKAAATLRKWVLPEMERRFKLFHESGVRNISAYNKKMVKQEKHDEHLPFLVVIVDELADLMMISANEVESTICRLAQMARATGIHLVIATQRPSVDVITGLIKANIPSRVAFAVATQIDSRVILDASGAEKLLGRGDMLFNPIGAMKPIRLQGSFVSDRETEKIINFIKKQADADYLEDIIEVKEEENGVGSASGGPGISNEKDSLFNDAVRVVLTSGQASTSHIQRRLRVGYNRAARLMDEIEAAGLVTKPEGDNKPRKITATPEQLKSLGIEL